MTECLVFGNLCATVKVTKAHYDQGWGIEENQEHESVKQKSLTVNVTQNLHL